MIINRFTPSQAVFQTDILSNKNFVKEAKNEGESFSGIFKKSLDQINVKQIEAEKAQEAFVKGEDVDIHEVMLAGAEAKLSLQVAVEVRNKLLDAYQEINRIQI